MASPSLHVPPRLRSVNQRRGLCLIFALSLIGLALAGNILVFSSLRPHFPDKLQLPGHRPASQPQSAPVLPAPPPPTAHPEPPRPLSPMVLAETSAAAPWSVSTAGIAPPRGAYPRIYCLVPTMRPRKLANWEAIMQTWGPECDAVRFVVDPDPQNPEANLPYNYTVNGHTAVVIPLTTLVRKRGNDCRTNRLDQQGKPVYTPCHHIWEKVWRSWVYVKDHEADLADFFFKIDDDTFAFPDNARRHILEHGWKAGDKHYFGHVVYTLGPTKPMVAGTMAGISRGTLEVLAEHYKKMEHEYGDRAQFKHGRCVDRDGATEEVTTSRCLRDLDIFPTPLLDGASSPGLVLPQVMIWQPKDLLIKKRRTPESWYFVHQPANFGQEAACCSPMPVAIHFQRQPDDMRRLHLLTADPRGECVLENAKAFKVPEWARMSASDILQGPSGQFMDPVAAVREVDYYLSVKHALRAWRGLPPLDCAAQLRAPIA